MYNELNKQLEEVQEQIFRSNKIKSMLGELNKQQEVLIKKVEKLKSILDKENEEVDKLESKSFAHLFYAALGKYGEKVEKEQQEAFAAKLKFEQAACELEQITIQIGQLEAEAIQYTNCKSVYDELYMKKKEQLITSNSETAQRIMELSKQLKDADNNSNEIEEAIIVGNEVMNHIEIALNNLSSAESWGTWDLLGGGLIADLEKHSHIDEAKGEAELIQSELSRFRTELADIEIQNNIRFEMTEFGKLADFFIDGLIADWCMQSKIEDSLSSVQDLKEQVEEVLGKLDNMKDTQISQVVKLKKDLDELVIRA